MIHYHLPVILGAALAAHVNDFVAIAPKYCMFFDVDTIGSTSDFSRKNDFG